MTDLTMTHRFSLTKVNQPEVREAYRAAARQFVAEGIDAGAAEHLLLACEHALPLLDYLQAKLPQGAAGLEIRLERDGTPLGFSRQPLLQLHVQLPGGMRHPLLRDPLVQGHLATGLMVFNTQTDALTVRLERVAQRANPAVLAPMRTLSEKLRVQGEGGPLRLEVRGMEQDAFLNLRNDRAVGLAAQLRSQAVGLVDALLDHGGALLGVQEEGAQLRVELLQTGAFSLRAGDEPVAH